MIKKVRILKFLRGTNGVEWPEGTILEHPIPRDILLEAKWKSGLVEVLEEGIDTISQEPPPPEIPTMTSNIKTDSMVEPDEPEFELTLTMTSTSSTTTTAPPKRKTPVKRGARKAKTSRRIRR
jgi:hypothetical protein